MLNQRQLKRENVRHGVGSPKNWAKATSLAVALYFAAPRGAIAETVVSEAAASREAAPPSEGAGTADTRSDVVRSGLPAPQLTMLDRSQLEQHSVPAFGVEGAAATRVQAYLEEQARSGTPRDVRQLKYVEVDIPGQGTFGAIIGRTMAIERAVLGWWEDGANNPRAILHAIVTRAPEGPESIGATHGGPGYDAASGTNATRIAQGCSDLWWDAAYSDAADHHVYDCEEKWKSNAEPDRWAYNRYTLFDPAQGSGGWHGEIVDATIRTRPWAGYESRATGGPFSYTPHPTSTCSTNTATINVGSVASLSIPLVSCGAELSVFPKGSDHSMGTDWNGRTSGQVFIDYAFEITTANIEPVYANYVWMEVQYCLGPGSCSLLGPSDYNTWQDSGWDPAPSPK